MAAWGIEVERGPAYLGRRVFGSWVAKATRRDPRHASSSCCSARRFLPVTVSVRIFPPTMSLPVHHPMQRCWRCNPPLPASKRQYVRPPQPVWIASSCETPHRPRLLAHAPGQQRAIGALAAPCTVAVRHTVHPELVACTAYHQCSESQRYPVLLNYRDAWAAICCRCSHVFHRGHPSSPISTMVHGIQ